MSLLSGKCDLLNHITGLGGYYEYRTKKAVKFGDEGAYCYTSDLLQDFEAFKEQVNGVIYQRKEVKLQAWFREEEFNFIHEHCPAFLYKKVSDNNKIKDYEFYYYDNTKSLTFKELKKKGIWIDVPIYFNTLLDLIPYLSYIIIFSCGSDVIITNESFVDSERNRAITEYAHDNQMFDIYKKKQADLYLEVCKNYFLYKLDERTKVISFADRLFKNKDGDYDIIIDQEIDYMHNIEFVWDDGQKYHHWASPKLNKDENGGYHIITLSKEDVEEFLKDHIKSETVKIKYVQKPIDGFPLYL